MAVPRVKSNNFGERLRNTVAAPVAGPGEINRPAEKTYLHAPYQHWGAIPAAYGDLDDPREPLYYNPTDRNKVDPSEGDLGGRPDVSVYKGDPADLALAAAAAGAESEG